MRALPLLAAGLLTWAFSPHPARAQAVEAVDGRTFFLPLVAREASLRGLPPEIADAVAMVETGYRADAIGSSGEVGLMQVMPSTAAQLGFRGTLSDLADPETNIRLGVTYLARAWRAGGGDICRALTKYRAGLGEDTMSPLSAQYCARATAWLMGGSSAIGNAASALPAAQAADPYVIVMPPAQPARKMLPMPPMPDGVQLTPHLRHGARRRAAGPAHARSPQPQAPLFPRPSKRSRDDRQV